MMNDTPCPRGLVILKRIFIIIKSLLKNLNMSNPSSQPTAHPSLLIMKGSTSSQPTAHPSLLIMKGSTSSQPTAHPSLLIMKGSTSSQPTAHPSLLLMKGSTSSQPTAHPSLLVMKGSTSSQPTAHPSLYPTFVHQQSNSASNSTTQPSSQPSSQPTNMPSMIMKSYPLNNLVNQNIGFHIVMAFVIVLGLLIIFYVLRLVRKSHHIANNKAIRKHLSPISLEAQPNQSPVMSQFRSKRMEEYFTLDEDDKEEFNGPLLNATRIVQSNPLIVQPYSQKACDDEESGNPLIK